MVAHLGYELALLLTVRLLLEADVTEVIYLVVASSVLNLVNLFPLRDLRGRAAYGGAKVRFKGVLVGLKVLVRWPDCYFICLVSYLSRELLLILKASAVCHISVNFLPLVVSAPFRG